MTGQPIHMLLCEDPIDWVKVKKRAKKHPNAISKKNFIHKLCLEPSVPPHIWDWALTLSHAPFQLLRKSGLDFSGKTQESSTPLELCLRDSVPYSTFVRIVQATHEADPNYCPRFDVISSTDILKMDIGKLRKLLETYDTKHFERAIEDFLLLPLASQTYEWGEIYGIEVEEKETRLELVLKAASRLWGCERTTSNGCFILTNTFLATVVPRYGRMYGLMHPSVLHHAMARIIGKINPFGFSFVDDQEGNTLLHYIMEYAANYINIYEGSENVDCDMRDEDVSWDDVDEVAEPSYRYTYWEYLVNMLLSKQQEQQPFTEWCASHTMMANNMGQTPLHIALLHGLPHSLSLVFAGDEEIMYQGLNPFQLAASAGSPATDCWCDRCYLCGYEQGMVALNNTYSLLRMKPDILLSSIAGRYAADTIGSGLVNCPFYKQIVMKELQIAQLSRQVKIMKSRVAGVDGTFSCGT